MRICINESLGTRQRLCFPQKAICMCSVDFIADGGNMCTRIVEKNKHSTVQQTFYFFFPFSQVIQFDASNY